MNFFQKMLGFKEIDVGERLLNEVIDMVCDSMRRRKMLSDHGWKRLNFPPIVNNEWVWENPRWGFKLESEAFKILKIELSIK